MKNKITTLAIIALTSAAYSQNFSGTAVDLNGNRIQVINGQINKIVDPRDESIDAFKRMNDELAVSIARQRQEMELRRQTYEIERQTRLLQEIADKQ